MNLKVIDAAIRDVVVCTEQYSIDDVARKTTERRFRAIPLESNGTFVGIISDRNDVNGRVEEAVNAANSLREYDCLSEQDYVNSPVLEN